LQPQTLPSASCWITRETFSSGPIARWTWRVSQNAVWRCSRRGSPSDLDALDGLSIRFALAVRRGVNPPGLCKSACWGVSPLLAGATIPPGFARRRSGALLIGVFPTRAPRRRMLALDAARTRLVDLDRGRHRVLIAGAPRCSGRALLLHPISLHLAAPRLNSSYTTRCRPAGWRDRWGVGRHPRRAAQRGGSSRLTQCKRR